MRWNQYLIAVIAVVNLMNGASPAPCADEMLLVAPQPANSSTLADKTAVLKGDWAAPGPSDAPVLSFGMDLLIGQQTGIRSTLALHANERSSFVVEGYYGGLFTKFGGSEGAGAGVRWVTSRGGPDAVTLGPGLDVLFNFNEGKATMLAPTVDIAWRHSFGNRAGLVLGINAGVGIGLSGHSGGENGDRMKNLEVLFMPSTKNVTKAGVDELQKAMPELQIVY